MAARPAEEAECVAAIRAIGTNAVPTLLAMIAARDGAFKTRLIKIVNGQSVIHIRIHPDNERLATAAWAFLDLGSNALPAVPGLIELTGSPDALIRWQAMNTLEGIHADGSVLLPVLTNCLHDADADIRRKAASDLAASFPSEARRLGISNNVHR